jgi:hypothetical protein
MALPLQVLFALKNALKRCRASLRVAEIGRIAGGAWRRVARFVIPGRPQAEPGTHAFERSPVAWVPGSSLRDAPE